MQYRHAQQIYLDCQGWAESPSRRLDSRPSWQTSQIIAPIPYTYVKCRYCRHTLQRHCSHRMQTRFVDALRAIHFERNCQCWTKLVSENWPKFVSVGWPVMFDERASVRSQAREQGQRLHDEGNDIDAKLAQVDVSSLHREAVPQSLS